MCSGCGKQAPYGVLRQTEGEAGVAPPSEFVCGAVASLVNTCITFPINKVMFRQQLQGIRLKRACKQLYKEGFFYLYRGLLPPLFQRTATVSLMFGTYANYYQSMKKQWPDAHHILVHSVAAIGAGTTEAIFAPFERVQVVLQVKEYHRNLRNSLDAFSTISRLGVREMYRGLSAILLRNGPSNALFLGLREPLMRSLPHSEGPFGEVVGAFISGAGLGAALSTAFFPLNVVKAKMQARIGGPFLSVHEALNETLAERNYRWKKLFRGVHLNYTRSFMSWGIINAVYEVLIHNFV